MASLQQCRKSPYWYVTWYQDGRLVWRSTKTTDRDQALAALAEVESALAGRAREDAALDLLRAAGAKPTDPRAPIAGLWEMYDRPGVAPDRKPATMRSKRVIVLRWQTWMAAARPWCRYLSEVTPRLALEYMRENFAARSGITWNNNLAGLREVFGRVRVMAGLAENVWEALPRQDARPISRQVFALAKVRALLREAKRADSAMRVPGFWPIAIPLAYHTGLRWHDVATLEWRELDWKARCIRVRPEKTSARRRRPLTPWFHPDFEAALREAFEHAAAPDGYVWPEIAGAVKARHRWMYAEWETLISAIGLEVRRPARAGERRVAQVTLYGFHSLRHTYGTELDKAGVALGDIQQALGHGSPIMTDLYVHGSDVWRRLAGKVPALAE